MCNWKWAYITKLHFTCICVGLKWKMLFYSMYILQKGSQSKVDSELSDNCPALLHGKTFICVQWDAIEVH